MVVKKSPPPFDLVLDGEVMSDNFQDLMKQVHRKDNVNAKDAVLHLFDFVPLDKFLAGGYDKPQSFRTEALKFWYDANKDALEHVQVLDHEIVNLDTPRGAKDVHRR